MKQPNEAGGPGAALSGQPEEMVLMIADISGYTKFMLANRQSIVHGQMIITDLTQTILRQIELPMEVSKLEGDAVFLYARKPADPSEQASMMQAIGGKIEGFFERFAEKLRELADSNLCSCAACSHVLDLRLKLIVHSGHALRFSIGRFEELSGTDVILLHRLLKNSVPVDEYVLLTDSAHRDLGMHVPGTPQETVEHYDVADVRVFVYLSAEAGLALDRDKAERRYDTVWYKLKNEWRKIRHSIRTTVTGSKME